MPTLKRTEKKTDQLFDQLAQRQTKLLRELLPPQSIAEAMYPRLQTEDERRLQEKRSQQKE